MLWVDIGDDAYLGGELQEGAVRLVGLDHHPLAPADTRIGAPVIDDAAGNHGGVEPAAFEQAGDQRCGRGLAVGAGDGDGGAWAHQLGQHLGAADDGDAALLGGFEFRIAGLHRGRDHESGRAVDIGRVVANQAADVAGAQAIEIGAVLEVAALHGVAAGMHHLGDGAHADAADADDMHEAGLLRIGHVHG